LEFPIDLSKRMKNEMIGVFLIFLGEYSLKPEIFKIHLLKQEIISNKEQNSSAMIILKDDLIFLF
jgi:hypothetical protein